MPPRCWQPTTPTSPFNRPSDQHVHHIPYANLVKIVEDDKGVEIRHLFTANERFNVVIKVGHVVTYMPT